MKIRPSELGADGGGPPVSSARDLLCRDGEEFLRLAYRAVLRRQADPDGMAHYLARLKSGARKSTLLYELYQSAEGQRVRQGYGGPKLPDLERVLKSEQRRALLSLRTLFGRLTRPNGTIRSPSRRADALKYLSLVESQAKAKFPEVYATIQPDVRAHLGEAIQNLFGAFDPDAYLQANPDVRLTGINAYEHYVRFGWLENRQIKPGAMKPQIRTISQDYQEWIRRYDTLDDVCRSALRAKSKHFRVRPLISVVMPTYNSRIEWLREAIESVRDQLYENWELCVADDCSTNPAVHALLEEYSQADERIKVVYRAQNGHISAASNSGLQVAAGEWIALLDHDDRLAEYALYFVVEAINRRPNVSLLYSDEDKLDAHGVRYDPYFKCDWNEDLFYSHNLISHLGVYRKAIVDAIGGFRQGYEGSQDHDLALRFIERIAASQIHHIPRVLYHWRTHSESTSLAASAKPYAAVAGVKALNGHFERVGVAATVEDYGYGYRVKYALPAQLPLVSLIIPTRNAHHLVRQCIESIRSKTLYPCYEILLIDNGSDEPESLRYFDELKTQEVRVLRDDRPFNFSALNNRAVDVMQGSIVCLLNNDVRVIEPAWLGEMVSHALRPEIGAVGAKLLYPDDTVQHAGVVVGVRGVASHSHKLFDGHSHGYFCRLSLISCYSAVTAACLAIRKNVFREVGGLDEENLAIAFNDIDFCLRVREAGYRNLFTPYALLYHHESLSRGAEDTPEKIQRFAREVRYMKKRWGNVLLTDPAYSPNLTLDRDDFSLAMPPRIDHVGIDDCGYGAEI